MSHTNILAAKILRSTISPKTTDVSHKPLSKIQRHSETTDDRGKDTTVTVDVFQ